MLSGKALVASGATWTLVAAFAAVIAGGLAIWHFEVIFFSAIEQGDPLKALLFVAFFCIPVLLMFIGNFAYFCCRYGFFRRQSEAKVPQWPDVKNAAENMRSVLILVPSYMEEPEVVRQTLMSAALVEHPDRRVVLLIDDPPAPRDANGSVQLMGARALSGELHDLFCTPAERYGAELAAFMRRRESGPPDAREECVRLSRLYHQAAAWFEGQAAEWEAQKGVRGFQSHRRAFRRRGPAKTGARAPQIGPRPGDSARPRDRGDTIPLRTARLHVPRRVQQVRTFRTRPTRR